LRALETIEASDRYAGCTRRELEETSTIFLGEIVNHLPEPPDYLRVRRILTAILSVAAPILHINLRKSAHQKF